LDKARNISPACFVLPLKLITEGAQIVDLNEVIQVEARRANDMQLFRLSHVESLKDLYQFALDVVENRFKANLRCKF